jgi:hypothetical protein
MQSLFNMSIMITFVLILGSLWAPVQAAVRGSNGILIQDNNDDGDINNKGAVRNMRNDYDCVRNGIHEDHARVYVFVRGKRG